ncbi:MAG TPA: hypothetical protein VK061_08580 [Bacillota bacterium]|nr:hypothetical protein [Bacillota bacterium]
MYNFKDACTRNEYPETEQDILIQSVEEFQILMWQGEILLNRLSDIDFSKKVMEAAQANEQDKVNELIQTIEGMFVPTDITYTPSGVIFKLESPAVSKGANCCTLNMTLKWGK